MPPKDVCQLSIIYTLWDNVLMAKVQTNAMNITPTKENYINFLASGQLDVDGRKWSKDDYAEMIGVNPSTLWRWEQADGFWNEVSSRVPQYIHRWIPKMTNVMVGRALKGDIQAYRMLLAQAQRLPDQVTSAPTSFADMILAAQQQNII